MALPNNERSLMPFVGTVFRGGLVLIAIWVLIQQFQKPQQTKTPINSVAEKQISKCTPEQFTISNQRFTVFDQCVQKSCPILKVVGKVKNECDQPYGVEIRVTAFSKTGDVIDTSTGWPFSVQNVEPQSIQEFNLDQIITYQKGMATFSMQAVDVRHWK